MAGATWPMESRIEAAVAYLMTGSIDEAAKLCNIPPRTIRDWTKAVWWEDVLNEARNAKQKELDAIWTGLIHKAADALRDRLDNGDESPTKFGIVKTKVKAKDIAVIMDIALKNRNLARGQPTARTEKITVEQKLDKIADRLERIGSKDSVNDETVQ